MAQSRKRKPVRVKIGDDTYTPAVLLVTERDQLGRPAVARFVHEDQKVDLEELSKQGTPEFIVAFCNKQSWGQPHNTGN